MNSSLPDGVKDASITLMESAAEAGEAAAEGVKAGEDAAAAEQVTEAESVIEGDPPPGVDVEAFADAWSDADAADVVSDPSSFDPPDASDSTGDVGGIF